MQYQTRHLEALTDVPFGDAYYTKGDRFPASVIDADYLVGHKKAKFVTESEVVVKPSSEQPAAEAQTIVRRRGRPPSAARQTVASPATEDPADTVVDTPAEDAPKSEA